jgi:heterotetrameric sarcosine oxidase gamma subunit
VAEILLTPTPVLPQAAFRGPGFKLAALPEGRIVTVNLRQDGLAAFEAAFAGLFGQSMPPPGRSVAGRGWRVMRIGGHRLMCVDDRTNEISVNDGVDALWRAHGYPVDHSDYWAGVEMSGTCTVEALRHWCRLDLEQGDVEGAARTSLEGIATVLLKLPEDRYRLWCPRSYAQSFWRMLSEG